MSNKTLIIGEAGVNHNGEERLAFQLVDLAVKAGVDIVKFQIFNSNKLVTRFAKKADYQSRNTGESGSQISMLKSLELSLDSHQKIAKYATKSGIQYLSSAFDTESLRFLAEEIGVTLFKVSSGDLTNAPFLLEHARYKRKIVVSTGMATLGDIEDALGVLAFGFLDSGEAPSVSAFRDAYLSGDGQDALKEYVTLLHCTTEYPTRPDEVNIASMTTLKQAFQLDVGYSDHSVGHVASVMAVALQAGILEKHFTLDTAMKGPDHSASMGPSELVEFVSAIRGAEMCLGSSVKRPMPSEVKNASVARRSLVASKPIATGDRFDTGNLSVMRPGTGLSPIRYWEVLGSKSARDYQEGELIDPRP